MVEQLTIKQATLLAMLVEGVLYGFSVLMFCLTMWALFYKRTTQQLNRLMVATTLILFSLSTMHVLGDAVRVYRGFIVHDGAVAYFGDALQLTFKHSVYLIQTLVADAVLIYRCHIVWHSWWIVIPPSVLWIGIAITGSHTVWSIASPAANGNNIFLIETGRWVLSFYSTAFATNFVATGFLAYKIWTVNNAIAHARSSSMTSSRGSTGPQTLHSLLLVIMECGALYSVSLLIMITTYATKSTGAYIVIDMIGQIIPITFYVIILRAAMAKLTEDQKRHMLTTTGASSNPSSGRGVNVKFQVTSDRYLDTELGTISMTGASNVAEGKPAIKEGW